MATYLLTYKDLIDHLTRYVGGHATASGIADIRQAIQLAWLDLANRRRWQHQYKTGRVILSAPYSTGTVAYDHTGGTNERQLTLTGGTWPSWSEYGTVQIDSINYKVDRSISSTVLTLDEQVNPGADIASGTSYTLKRGSYTLPQDLISFDQILTENVWYGSQYVPPHQWLGLDRYNSEQGSAYAYTVMADLKLPGRLGLFLYPPPDAAATLDFAYNRRPAQLLISGEESAHFAGTVSISSGGVAVTGSATSFLDSCRGAILRLSGNSTLPTGLAGTNPFIEQHSIAGYTSSTSITLATAVSQQYTASKYVISSPVDIEAAEIIALLRGCEYQLGVLRNFDNKSELQALYQEALYEATVADRRTAHCGYMGDGANPYRVRYADYPLGEDDNG